MKHRYTTYLAIAAMLMLAVPVIAVESEVQPIAEAEVQPVTIHFTASGQLRITGAKGQTVYIYNVTGVKIASFEIGSDDETLRLNLRRGGYLVKVGDVTRKIAVTR